MVLKGYAFQRNANHPQWKANQSRAKKLATEVKNLLKKVEKKLLQLRQLGWDGGGQPFWCEVVERRQRKKTRRRDGSPMFDYVRVAAGSTVEAKIHDATACRSVVRAMVTCPTTSMGLVEQGVGVVERCSGILPQQFNPTQDHEIVSVLTAIASILTPAELTFLKAPSGHHAFVGSGSQYTRWKDRKPYTGQNDGVAYNKERSLLTLAERLAAPSSAAYARTLTHHGVRDGPSCGSSEWRESFRPFLRWMEGATSRAHSMLERNGMWLAPDAGAIPHPIVQNTPVHVLPMPLVEDSANQCMWWRQVRQTIAQRDIWHDGRTDVQQTYAARDLTRLLHKRPRYPLMLFGIVGVGLK